MTIKNLSTRISYLIFCLVMIVMLTSCSKKSNSEISNYEIDNAEIGLDDFSFDSSFDSSSIESKMDLIEIKTLLYQSVMIEFKGEEIELDNVYTKEFVDSMEDTFYKTDSATVNIKSTDIECNPKEDSDEKEYIAKIEIETGSENYSETISIIVSEDNYRISQIDYENKD